jgi:ketosteroid isomerase-like protein
MSANNDRTADEDAIRDLVENWARAVRTKNLNGILANHSPEILMFDVPPPIQSKGIESPRFYLIPGAMKTKTLLAVFAVAALAIAQVPPTYTAAEAAKHVGETATVKDRVDCFHQSGKGNIFLNMGG